MNTIRNANYGLSSCALALFLSLVASGTVEGTTISIEPPPGGDGDKWSPYPPVPVKKDTFCDDKTNGWFCDTANGKKDLVRCSSDHTVEGRTPCANSCHVAPVGTPDFCDEGGPTQNWVYPMTGNRLLRGWYISLSLGDSWSTYYGHLGQDFLKSDGTSALNEPFYAVSNGVIEEIDRNVGNYKDIIIIRHTLLRPTGEGDTVLYSRYGHTSVLDTLHVGDKVTAGQKLGTLADPVDFVPHMHLEIVNAAAFSQGPFCNGCAASNIHMSPGYRGTGFSAPLGFFDHIKDITGNRFYSLSWLIEHNPVCERSQHCSTWDDDVTACDAHGHGKTQDCAYYFCSDKCRARGTSNCEAECSSGCAAEPDPCGKWNDDLNGCNAHGYGTTQDCAYYFCSGMCRARGTSNCEAGCAADCFNQNYCQ